MHHDCARTLFPCARGIGVAYLFALCAGLAACAGAPMSHTALAYAGPIDPHDRAVSRYDLLRDDEIRAGPFETAFDAVRQLRPRYLTVAHTDYGVAGGVSPVVVIEGGLPEPIDVLKGIAADAVAEIRFIEALDAVTKFGARYSGGVVTVRLASRGRSRGSP